MRSDTHPQIQPAHASDTTLVAAHNIDETVSLDAPIWNYWAVSFAPYRVVWGKDGRIKEIITDPVTRSRMVQGKSA